MYNKLYASSFAFKCHDLNPSYCIKRGLCPLCCEPSYWLNYNVSE